MKGYSMFWIIMELGIVARQDAEDLLSLNPETGRGMTHKELLLSIGRKQIKYQECLICF